MFKHNLIFKKIKKPFLSINDSIESYFDSFRSFTIKLKKNKYDEHNKAFIIIGTLIILTLGYFLLPTIYDRNIVKSKIQNQLFKKFNIEVRFENKISYGLFPKPHFNSKNLIILNNKKKIAKIKNFKIFINFDKFFSINNIKTKDVIFKKADFNINKDDFLFFSKLLFLDETNNKIIFKDSNIFFLNDKKEVLFINKIKKGIFFYDEKNLENLILSKNEIFNIPYKIIFKNNKINKNFSTEFNAKKIRLNIENEIDYNKEVKKGILNMRFINKSTLINYNIEKDLIKFSSKNNKNTYNGQIDFKPFYLNANFNYEQINSKNFLYENSIFHEIIKSQILNNKNLNLDIDFNIRKLININHLNNIVLKIAIQEGDIILNNSNLMWKNDLKITLKESFLTYDDNGVKLIGKINIDYENIDSFYKTFQIRKKNRKDIKLIEIDFIYSFTSKEMSFDNVKIDNLSNVNLEKFLDKFNSKESKLTNMVIFKNFMNSFFSAYDG